VGLWALWFSRNGFPRERRFARWVEGDGRGIMVLSVPGDLGLARRVKFILLRFDLERMRPDTRFPRSTSSFRTAVVSMYLAPAAGGETGLEHAKPGLSMMPAGDYPCSTAFGKFANRFLFPGAGILWLGCSRSGFPDRLEVEGCRVWVVDVDLAGLEKSRSRRDHPGIGYAAMDLGSLAFRDESFNLVVAVDLLQTGSESDGLVERLHGLLADGGYLVGVVPGSGPGGSRGRRTGGEAVSSRAANPFAPFSRVYYPEVGPCRFFQARKLVGLRPKVSALMTVCNGARWLEASVRSVLEQDFPDFELVVIDDGSTDATPEILAGFNDPRLRVFRVPRAGRTPALNKGLVLARGEYVAIVDSDDISLPSRFREQAAFLDDNPDYVMVGSAYGRIGPDGEDLGADKVPTDDAGIRSALAGGNQFMHGSVMFRADVVLGIGGYREFFRYSQDYDLWLRLVHHGKVANLPLVLYKWRVNPFGITITRAKEQRRFQALARKFYRQRLAGGFDDLDLSEDGESAPGKPEATDPSDRLSRCNFHFYWGKSNFLVGRVDQARRHFYLGLKLCPFSVRHWLYFGLSHVPSSTVRLFRNLVQRLRRIGIYLP